MKNLIKITFGSLCLGALFLVGCGPDDPATPKVVEPTPTTDKIEEYIEVNGIRVTSAEFENGFAKRKFSTDGNGPLISVPFEKDGIKATDFRWEADSTFFTEKDYIPTYFAREGTHFGIALVGYTSGTGSFSALNVSKSEYDACRLKKKNGKWYIEVENLLMEDSQKNFSPIRVSARIIWQNYTQ